MVDNDYRSDTGAPPLIWDSGRMRVDSIDKQRPLTSHFPPLDEIENVARKQFTYLKRLLFFVVFLGLEVVADVVTFGELHTGLATDADRGVGVCVLCFQPLAVLASEILGLSVIMRYVP